MISITWKEYNELCDKLDNSGLDVRFIDGKYYGTNIIFVDDRQIAYANFEFEDYGADKKILGDVF